jgi:hypothetical protein
MQFIQFYMKALKKPKKDSSVTKLPEIGKGRGSFAQSNERSQDLLTDEKLNTL